MRRQVCVALKMHVVERISAQRRDGRRHILQSFRAALRRDDDLIESIARSGHCRGARGHETTQNDQHVSSLHSSPKAPFVNFYCSNTFLRPTTRAYMSALYRTPAC